jgi:hypothetical protein
MEVVRESSAVNFDVGLDKTSWSNMKLDMNEIISDFLKVYGTMITYCFPLTQLAVMLSEFRIKLNENTFQRAVLPKGRSFNIKSLVYKFYVQQPNWEYLQVGEYPCYINVYKKNNYDTDVWKDQYRTTNQAVAYATDDSPEQKA